MTIDELPDTGTWCEVETIVDAICKRHGITKEQLMSASRTDRNAWARFLAFYVIHATTNETFSSIGRYFRKDHGTVLNGVRQVEKRMQVNPEYRVKVNVWVSFFCKTLHETL